MTIATTKWNVQDHLKTNEDIAEYLLAAIEENDPEFLVWAVQDAVQAIRTLT